MQAGNDNYLLPPSLKLCLRHQLRVILGEKTLTMTGSLLPWLPCGEARQARLGVGDLFPASFQLRKHGQCHKR